MLPPAAWFRLRNAVFGVYLPCPKHGKVGAFCQVMRVAKAQGLWHVSPILVRCCSSVVEHSIGNGEVDSSILSSSTIFQSGLSGSPKSPLTRRCRAR